MTTCGWMRQILGIMLGAAVLLGASTQQAEACSCMRSTVETSYFRHSDVAIVLPIAERPSPNERVYLALVRKVYKGCLTPGSLVWITTNRSSAACGITLGSAPMLINGSRRANGARPVPRIHVGQCDYNVLARDLTDRDRKFLDGRYVCCGDECGCADGSEPVNCLADPCVAAPPCDEGTCTANYCGSCNAEYFDEIGVPMCQAGGGCYSDADCPANRVCNAEEVCYSPPECSRSEICPAVCYGQCVRPN